jgi:ATP-dependent DNA helicase DinG
MKQAPPATLESVISKTPANSERAARLKALGLQKFVAIDLETTGLTPANEAIIEVGAVKFLDGEVADIYQTFIDPERPLPRFITSLTGIRDEDLLGAPSFEEISNDLLEFIGDSPLVGQNTSFDLGFLTAHGGTDYRFPGRMILDTAELARIFWAELPRFSLSSLCRTFGVTLASAHRASDDAKATGEILVHLAESMRDRVWGDLAGELYAVASQGHHRAEKFFAALQSMTVDVAATPAPKPDTRPELTELSVHALSLDQEFHKNLEQFEPRHQQTQMAALVQSAFENEEVLLLEAPTGTGKSLGYLVPALEWALGGGDDANRQVIISSHTRSLQEQLLNKDIRDIGLATKSRVPAAILKGRDNYLCKRRLRTALLDIDGRLSDGERHKLLPLIRWSHLTTRGDIGEIGGFRPEHEPILWAMVCSDGGACSGAMCGANRGDYYRKALDEAKKAKLLLVNHALLSTDFERFISPGEEIERRLVIDEAHQFERAVVSAYSTVFSDRVVRNVLSRFSDERSSRGLLAKLAKSELDDDVSTELVALDVMVKTLFQKSRLSFQEAAGMPSRTDQDETRSRLRHASPDQQRLESILTPLINDFDELFERLDKVNLVLSRKEDLTRDTKEKILELRSAVAELESAIEVGKLSVSCDESDHVYWVESSQRRTNPTVALFASPIFVSETLDKQLWKNTRGTVLTSATLAQRGDFAGLESALGIRESGEQTVKRSVLDSPFNLPLQMHCYCPTYLPDAKQVQPHLTGVALMISELIKQTNRSILVLCTSHASADDIVEKITPISRKHSRQLFQQRGGRDTHEIVKAFRESQAGVLVGSAALWEGIDLVGEALEILIVVKLPFDVPTEPWHEARGELATSQKKDPFYSLSLPACATRLRQGLGRLIRHQSDRGVAIITDTRLLSTRYGKVLQQHLPVKPEPAENLPGLITEIKNFFQTNNDTSP